MQPVLPQRAEVLGKQVADALRRAIITQELPSGSLLVEARLADDFQVSRGPIRDALQVLISEGLAVSRGRSAQVVGLTADDIDELFTLRAALETLALSTAMASRRPQLLSLLDLALRRMRAAVEARDIEEFTLSDMEFHSAFGIASAHRRLVDVWHKYQPTILDLLLVANLEHDDLEPSLAAHELLADLIRDERDTAALDEISSHLDNSRLRLRKEYVGGAAVMARVP
jgi:GntR family transcriptional regulator of gluconate operon